MGAVVEVISAIALFADVFARANGAYVLSIRLDNEADWAAQAWKGSLNAFSIHVHQSSWSAVEY